MPDSVLPSRCRPQLRGVLRHWPCTAPPSRTGLVPSLPLLAPGPAIPFTGQQARVWPGLARPLSSREQGWLQLSVSTAPPGPLQSGRGASTHSGVAEWAPTCGCDSGLLALSHARSHGQHGACPPLRAYALTAEPVPFPLSQAPPRGGPGCPVLALTPWGRSRDASGAETQPQVPRVTRRGYLGRVPDPHSPPGATAHLSCPDWMPAGWAPASTS